MIENKESRILTYQLLAELAETENYITVIKIPKEIQIFDREQYFRSNLNPVIIYKVIARKSIQEKFYGIGYYIENHIKRALEDMLFDKENP